MRLKKVGAFALAAILFGVAPLGAVAHAETKLRALSAWATSLPSVPDVFYKFQEAATKASNGEITFQNTGPETVPPFEQLEPLSQGVFDIVFQTSTYHQAQTGMGVALQNLIDIRPGKLRSTGMLDWLNDYYRKNFGVVILSIYPAGPTTFVLTSPLSEDSKLTGLKIRTNASYEGIVRALGGTPVAMSPADAYAAMQKGTLDGAAWPVSATADFKLYEVAKYMAKPYFSQGCNLIMMNAAKFDALPKELQDALLAAGEQTDILGDDYMQKQVENQEKLMLENGVQFTEFSPEVSTTIAKMDIEAAIEVASRSRPEDVQAALAVAKEKGVLFGEQ